MHDIRPLKFHCTKHTFVTWALEAGKPSTRVAYWVGTSVRVIEDTYRHVLPHDDEGMSFTGHERGPDRHRTNEPGRADETEPK